MGGHTLEYIDRSLLTKVSTPTGPSISFAYDAAEVIMRAHRPGQP
ncbi:hypothetical protein OHA25_20145 [Nonomuraea sp. NBC_00507]